MRNADEGRTRTASSRRSGLVGKTPILPAHIEETVEAIAKFHADHHEQTQPLQRRVDQCTARVSHPLFVCLVVVAAVVWMGLNIAVSLAGIAAIDPPPFAWLQGFTGLAALVVASLILTTQSRDDELAAYREQLTLDLSILGEQKSAKIIALLEELRRDMPAVADRIDREAKALAVPSDPQAVLDAIKEQQEET